MIYTKTATTVQKFSTAADIAHALNGRRTGNGYIARCPVHDDKSPSLSIRDGEHSFLLKCFAGCDGREIVAEMRRQGLLLNGSAIRPEGRVMRRPTRAEPPPIDRIRNVLARSTALRRTLGERYIIQRDIDPELADERVLRFLPGNDRYLPAMVAVVTAFTDASRVVGLQFTPIKPDGTRGERTFLRGSRIGGGVIRLVEDADITTDLGVAEGVESALAVMTAQRRDGRMVLPTWSALNAGNMARLPVLPALERLYIFADRDKNGVGQRAAEALATRWREAGREVRVALPPGADWNSAVAA